MWNNSKIHFLLFLSKIPFQCDISLRNVLFPDYEIPIKLKKITDDRIKNFITSKQAEIIRKVASNSLSQFGKVEKITKYRLWSYSTSNQPEKKNNLKNCCCNFSLF
jgi:hypothetical protein